MKKRRPTAAVSDLSARERLVTAGTALFMKTPFDKVSAAQIAAKANVAHGLMFHYFGSKLGLYEEVSRRAIARIEGVLSGIRSDMAAEKRLRLFFDLTMDLIKARRADYLLHLRGSTPESIKQMWEDGRRRSIVTIFGYYGINNPSPHLTVIARAWLGFFDELMLAWILDSSIKKESVIDLSIEIFYQIFNRAGLFDVDEPLPRFAGNKKNKSSVLRLKPAPRRRSVP